eukprot:TRINITY_DN3272_c0_g1_i7.p1 TRINITY_DN3272_c0_g1~~TRINITY_DN3272_c0_g1_i7.p1  ORF type:complete len:688 (-),score=118.99 TRINITY_DN3272_c0_g1_i7:535-2598(-)
MGDRSHRHRHITMGNTPQVLELEWSSPSLLSVQAIVTLLPEVVVPAASPNPPVDWLLRFANNNASSASGVLSHLAGLNYSWAAPDHPAIATADGSHSDQADFTHRRYPLNSTTPLAFAPEDYYNGHNNPTAGAGRSSNGQMPFFALESGEIGVHMALGWSGQWRASFQATRSGTVNSLLASNASGFVLLPTEAIRHFRVMVASWKSGELDGVSDYSADTIAMGQVGLVVLRRVILSHYAARNAAGHLIYPKVASLGYPNWIWTGGDLNETNQLAIVKALKAGQANVEEFWIDTGWYDSIAGFAGNWARPLSATTSRSQFPNGVGVVFDYAKNATAGRAMAGVLWACLHAEGDGEFLALHHPDWLLRNPQNYRPGAENTYGLDLANPAAVAWASSWVVDSMVEWNYDIFRHEMGMDFAHVPFWGWKDAQLEMECGLVRGGFSEIGWVSGLYDFWDQIRALRPGAVLDLCSGGGRNIDLETISRGIWKWRSDHSIGTTRSAWERSRTVASALSAEHQSMTMGLGHYHPMNAHFSYWADGFSWRSAATTGIVMAWDVRTDNSSQLAMLAKAVAETQRLRRYTVSGDLWWLTEQSLASNVWAAWQFHVVGADSRASSSLALAPRPRPQPVCRWGGDVLPAGEGWEGDHACRVEGDCWVREVLSGDKVGRGVRTELGQDHDRGSGGSDADPA